MSKIEYEDIIAFHPGYYVNEIIEDMEITQSEFAKRLDTSEKTISKLVNGEISISDDLVQKLSNMMGTSVNVWLNIQKNYDGKVIEIKKKKQFDLEKEYLKVIDYSYFAQMEVIKRTRVAEEKIANLCKFLKVSSLGVLNKKDLMVACRTAVSDVSEKNIINSNAWIQTALNIAEKIPCKPYNRKQLLSYSSEIREMTLKKPEDFYPRLCQILNECGVAFVVLPHLKNSGVNGAVKWINSNKVLLALNNRRLYADLFWFSLFHEIKHVLQQKIKETFVSSDKNIYINCKFELEEEADEFAKESLIPKDQYTTFLQTRNFSEEDVIAFAETICIHPGVVVGRLQYDGYLEYYDLVHLKEKYVIRLN